MAVPKKKTSKRRSASRTAANMGLKNVTLSKCPKCGEPKKSHVVCSFCGYYGDKKILNVKTKLDKKLSKEGKQQEASDKE